MELEHSTKQNTKLYQLAYRRKIFILYLGGKLKSVRGHCYSVCCNLLQLNCRGAAINKLKLRVFCSHEWNVLKNTQTEALSLTSAVNSVKCLDLIRQSSAFIMGGP